MLTKIYTELIEIRKELQAIHSNLELKKDNVNKVAKEIEKNTNHPVSRRRF